MARRKDNFAMDVPRSAPSQSTLRATICFLLKATERHVGGVEISEKEGPRGSRDHTAKTFLSHIDGFEA